MFKLGGVDAVYERRADAPEPFPSLCRVTGLPPLVAQSAFDAMHASRFKPKDSTAWEIQVAGGCLKLRGDGLAAPPPPPPRVFYWALRDVSGTIRSVWWRRPVHVRLELVTWSDTRTALTLTVRKERRGASGALYQRIGRQALDVLAVELDAWPFYEPVETSSSTSYRSADLDRPR